MDAMINPVEITSYSQSITLQDKNTLTFNDSVLNVGALSSQLSLYQRLKFILFQTVPHRQILRANFEPNTRALSIPYIAKGNKKLFQLHVFEGIVQESDTPHAERWVEVLMKAIYEDAGIKRSRRLLVLINPFGGRKKGVETFSKLIHPIFKMAECSLEVIYTTRTGHAQEIAKELTLDFDAVITVSGDGLVHEVLNGFAQHADSTKAFAIPVAPIPTGSGNGLSLNLLGIEDGFDVVAAALNAIKGKPMKVDVFSVTQGGKRTISFMSQSLGLMADLDIGTDNLRWMGDGRFIYGLLRGLVKFKPCSVQLSFKLEEDNKEKMAAAWQSRKEGRDLTIPNAISSKSVDDTLPSLKYLQGEEDGWTIFNDSFVYVYAGKGPYVGRDFMAFPVSLPDDGLIDVMTMSRSSRSDILLAMDGAPEGQGFWNPKVHYVKAHAYRVKPLKKDGCVSVDGESFPFEEFQVDVEKGLATFLSPYGHYAANFGPKRT
ncbi:hypothetical protein BYT27DRAFT_6917060 [Phlegmacium glaucopus]|nr:hypothetical protein BYT27DRAFT_6917060 [Phlegmacium glaucopus]